ncbi:MAG: hypothetical protein PHD76_10250 [Methylacidiphilales bacterium]|nr:hypothetical protein [Candidatus Methylacidiphilales bacterium]
MKIASLICVGILAAFATAQAAEPPSDAQAASNKLLSALVSSDYAAFVADGDTAFKGLKKEMFDSVAAQLAPRFKAGYEAVYLGEMKQKGYQVTLWKLSFKDGGDDALATLSLKNAKIGGYWIR